VTGTIRKLVQFYTGHILEVKDQDIIGFKIFFLSLCVCSDVVSNLTLLIFIRKCSPISSITNALLAGGLQVTPMLFVTHIEKEKGLYSGSSN
jgi:hypothetical protein